MSNATARLAHKITWTSSKQSYLTALLLADHDLADDCLRAYAYLRWADDRIDISLKDPEERSAFIEKQKSIIEKLYRRESVDGLCIEETMLAELIGHDRGSDSGLRSFIDHFIAVIAFDADRHARAVSRRELSKYTANLATAVMDGIQYFIGNGHPYPKTHDRNLAVTGAHITHMLRDIPEDLAAGIINIPAEYLNDHGISPMDMRSDRFRAWVREQVQLARYCFQEGRTYIDSLDVLRCKLAGVWYCARFECILNAIERDGYILRAEYPERHCLKAWLRMFGLAVRVTVQHLTRRVHSQEAYASLVTGRNIPSYHIK